MNSNVNMKSTHIFTKLFVHVFCVLNFLQHIKVVSGQSCVTWNQMNDTNQSGGSYMGILSLVDCQNACIINASCTGIDMNKDGMCWLSWYTGHGTHPGVTHYTITRNSCTTHTISTSTTTSPTSTTTVSTTTETTSSTTPTITTTSATVDDGGNASVITSSQKATGLDEKTKTLIIGVVVGVGGGIILIVFIVLLVCCILRRQRRRRRREMKQKPIQQLSPELLMEGNKISPPDVAVKIENLQAYFDEMIQSNGIQGQFSLLPDDDSSKATVGVRPVNKMKNRFKNILPYDFNRVLLPVTEEKYSDQDYINASYIKTQKSQNTVYIATQGPKKETLVDFWKMVWSEKIDRMAMIALTVENGKARCERYWPDETGTPVTYGDITVTLIEWQNFTDFTRRTMEVQLNGGEGGGPRTVIQLQYLVWPDKSTPNELWSLLSFRRRVRALMSTSVTGGPLLVHCSAGVGRTGTFMSIDTLLDDVNETGQVNVMGVVQYFRQQRMSSVQVKDQYEMIYRSLIDAYKSGNTVTPKEEVRSKFTGAMNSDCMNTLQKEYKILNESKPQISSVEELDALQPLNQGKNRSMDSLPMNKQRVYVMPSDDDSDYINAVYVKGYNMPASYILTQLPLHNTVCDFWRMILAERCTTVVMLDRVSSDQTTTVEFWPKQVSDLPTNFGSAAVMLLSSRPGNKTGSILVHTLHVTGRYTKTPVKLTVLIAELTTWTSDQQTPNNVEYFLELNHLVADWERQQPQEPTSSETSRRRSVTVMCLDGATRSGLYAATSTAVDRLNWDEELDVFLSCRNVTAVRPKAITSLDQYVFAHRVAARSLTWTPPTDVLQVATSAADPIYNNIGVDEVVGNDIYENSADIAKLRVSEMTGVSDTQSEPVENNTPLENSGHVYANFGELTTL